MTPRLEAALRWSATAHDGQTRKGCKAPYFEHVVGVAMILDRLGFAEDVVVAGLLHDVVEDTQVTLDDVQIRFGEQVAMLVGHCSEVKSDAQGKKRPWIDRKRDHLVALADAPAEALAVVLADKLHNLVSMLCDLNEGVDVWAKFNADRTHVLWYYRTSIAQFGTRSPELEQLACECGRVLDAIESHRGAR